MMSCYKLPFVFIPVFISCLCEINSETRRRLNDYVDFYVSLPSENNSSSAVSGEQFMPISREESRARCTGCFSYVNPQAKGVSELAYIGVRQLNSLEPNIQHYLNSVVDVKRQVVNGVRYVLTLLIDYSCLTPETDPCLTTKACKVTILEKPWMHLPNGSKYRTVLANNCTEEWLFSYDSAVVSRSVNKENNNIPDSDGF